MFGPLELNVTVGLKLKLWSLKIYLLSFVDPELHTAKIHHNLFIIFLFHLKEVDTLVHSASSDEDNISQPQHSSKTELTSGTNKEKESRFAELQILTSALLAYLCPIIVW